MGRLEARLGVRLMTRSTRRLALTEDRRRFHARCSGALDELAAAEADIAQAGRGGDIPRGVLRLVAPDPYGRRRVVLLVARYLAISVGLPQSPPPDFVAGVSDRLRHGFFAAPAYFAARGQPETLAAALADHDDIPYGAGNPRCWNALTAEGF